MAKAFNNGVDYIKESESKDPSALSEQLSEEAPPPWGVKKETGYSRWETGCIWLV